jgi:hypothetical protein
MKKTVFLFCLLLTFGLANAQDLNLKAKIDEVTAIINEHKSPLEEMKEKLGEHQAHLDERIITLKYHAGNKEVQDACRLVVTNIELYYKSVEEKIKQYESVWFEQSRNLIAIYTHYGKQVEASGGSQNDLSPFVDQHSDYLDLIANIKSDMSGVYTSLVTIKNAI